MKKETFKKTISVFICISFLLSAFSICSFADQSGFVWDFDESTKTLTVSGRVIPDYSDESPAPWKEYYSGIETIIIEDSVEYIGSFAFRGCNVVEEITIPDSVKGMGNGAFAGCTSLEKVNIGNGLEKISAGAFMSCFSLKSVIFPAGLKEIGNFAFCQCSSLEKIDLPDSLISIGGLAFSKCKELSEINFSGSLEEVSHNPFLETKWFDEQSGWITLGDAAIGYTGKINERNLILEFEKGTKVIAGGFSLAYALNVKRVVIPESVKYIGEYAFYSSEYWDIDDIFYEGTEEEWNEICILDHNDYLINAGIHFSDKPFSDVSADKWYAEPAVSCCMNGLITGTAKNVFSPDIELTRAMFATILASYDGAVTDNGKSSFKDVETDKWYTGAIEWANENNIMNGKGNGIFDPNASITREEMMTVLGRYAEYKNIELDSVKTSVFADDDSISSWAYDCVMTMKANGVIEGKGGNIFAPKDATTRAEAAQILVNYTDIIEGQFN